jgi:hypothetical protein
MKGNEYVVQPAIAMTGGSLLRIEGGRGLLLYVWEGALWLTQEGDARDRHVGAGEWLRLERDGLAVASALGRTLLSITAHAPERYARRISLKRAGSALPVELYRAPRPRRFWQGLFEPRARPAPA